MQLTCCDAYGSMLWDFQSPAAQQFFKAWNVQVRQARRVPRNTFTYLVEGYFASSFTPVRDMIYCRYVKFTQSLSESRSEEVRFMFQMTQHDPRSITRKNIAHVEEITKTDIQNMSVSAAKQQLPRLVVPEAELWRLGLLTTLLSNRQERHWGARNTNRTQEMIDSLCNS